MNRLWLPRSPRLLAGLTVAATVLLLGGCLKKNIVWSPDGQQAAVISQDGLRFCGADGALSSPSSPGVYLVAWLGDSQHLLVARERPAANWAEVARVLGSERTQQIAAAVEAAWAKVKQGALWSVVTLDLLNENPLPQFCLRELHGSELRPKLSTEEWAALTGVEVKLHEVALARRQDGRVELGTPLFTDLGMVADLRLAPGEKAVAITVAKSARNGDHHRLVVAALDGAVPPAALANEVSAYPDWAIDGRALVYCQSPGLPEKDQVQFGVFQQREVLGPDGKLAPAEKAVDLGGGLFQPLGRIRCLPDGRIVFNASELTLPVVRARPHPAGNARASDDAVRRRQTAQDAGLLRTECRREDIAHRRRRRGGLRVHPGHWRNHRDSGERQGTDLPAGLARVGRAHLSEAGPGQGRTAAVAGG